MDDDLVLLWDYDHIYLVSADGHVYRPKKYDLQAKELKGAPDRYGYLRVNLIRDGKFKTEYVHRLVAEAFLPNDDNLPEVNHINHDPSDNRMENLEWVSHSENIKHSYKRTRGCGKKIRVEPSYS